MRLTQALCLGLGSVVGLCRAIPVSALPDVTLWVVQPPGELVAFNLSDFSRIGGVRIPPVAFRDPRKLSINGHGQFLVQLDDDHLWIWDGTKSRTLPVAPDIAPHSTTPPPARETPLPQWLLGDDGNSLFVLQGAADRHEQAPADTAATRFSVSETDLSQRPRRGVFSRVIRPCLRAVEPTGDEPCPGPSIWAPGGVVREHFLFTYWEPAPGADSSVEDHPHGWGHRTRYWRGPRGWQATQLEVASEAPPLDSSVDGSAWIEASTEGWYGTNENSDQIIMVAPDTSMTLFDEWASFHNQDYDVSFFTANACIAPGGQRVAYTVQTASVAQYIPVSKEGLHPDSLELMSIRGSLADLPLVEVVEARPRPARLLRLAHAEMVGWASDSELVVIEKGHLVAVNVLTKQRRRSNIAVRTAADAFVVWRSP